MRPLNFVMIRLTLCLILGILSGHYFSIDLELIALICSILIALLGIAYILSKSQYTQAVWFGILIIITTTCIGVLNTKVHDQSNFKHHYTHEILIKSDSFYTLTFRIREVLKPGNYYDKYIVDILQINEKKVSGRSFLNVAKDSTQIALKVDYILIAKSQFKSLTSPLNPHQFDYKDYLSKKYIYHQLYAAPSQLLRVQSRKHTVYGFSAKFREHINRNLEISNFKPDQLAIINALLLGQRQDISKEIYDSYTQAGAIHILAVSGLHVGIILLLLNYLLKPFEHIKYGKILKTILLVTILWCFAIIAGLSASVVRAVTMFTIIAIGMNLKRPTNIYNTLAISMFFLLLFKPAFLFDVGFQLSYLAVFGIVIIQPMLYSIWHPNYKVTDFFWKVFTVTVAAQIAVIPISLYYFHQFPGLFFVSNLVIIPFLGLILGLGICIIALSILQCLPNILVDFYGLVIDLLNGFVHWISRQETFLITDISFGPGHVFMSYLLIATTILYLKKRTFSSLISVLITVILAQVFLIFHKYQVSNNQFIVFHKSRYSLIGIKQNTTLTIYHNLDKLEKENSVINYKVGAYINEVFMDSIKQAYYFNGKKLLVVDSLGIYNIKSFKPDIILLRNSPKCNLKRMIDSLQPELIISDGSNYKSYQKRWERTCKAEKIPFHQTDKKGAFINKY